ncbi:GLPGLI family protein [Pedobacter frigidisoli]|uniref:GLPGLI family protein n=1 Tax=Pedobacter frigidisoli TaxID=2530455 RepID=UPI00292DE82D|nr:GLPGLI family protein [Pedobacter frigidisoli]
MKRISITTIGLLGFFTSFAQQPDQALARVRYTFTHVQDTSQRDKPHIENMLLVTGKNASVYTSYDKLNQAIKAKAQILEQLKNQAGSSNMKIEIKSEMKSPITAADLFFYANEHKMFSKEKLLNNYLIEEPASQIDWKILKDTMTLSGIPCQKATADFKGRKWIAWYATEIPFQSGPWKLNGLPGLIIEACDEKREVKFEFAGLENVKATDREQADEGDQKFTTANGSVGTIKIAGIETSTSYLGDEIKLPKDAVKTTKKELDKLKAARDQDPQGFMQAQMAANGIQGTFKSSIPTTPAKKNPLIKKEINNPIELSDKK